MIRPGQGIKNVYLYKDFVDMRKRINRLAILVEAEMKLSLFEPSIFVFCSRSRRTVKILCWERNGFILWEKRLEKDRFVWPKLTEGSPISLTVQQLNWLIDGIDISKINPHKKLSYQTVL